MVELPDTIVSITVRKVVVPFALAPKTASGSLDNFAAVLIDLHTRNGVIGRSYVWSFSELFLHPLAASVDALAQLVINEPLAPQDLESTLRSQLRLIDTPGLLGLALSGLDMAAWDAFAVGLGLPLARVLGTDKTQVPAYNSCGLWIQEPAALADEVQCLLDLHGLQAMKLRLGRADAAADLEAVDVVRKILGCEHPLMVDYNQSLSVAEAMRRLPALDRDGLYWIEEPIRHADFDGMAQVTQALSTPTQIGENLCDDFAMQRAIAANAARYYMPDLQRIGGISGWLRASALCHANHLPLSSHLFPEFSVHALAASPTRHWLEYVDWANPLLLNPLQVANGVAKVPERAGAGLEWDEDAVSRYLIN